MAGYLHAPLNKGESPNAGISRLIAEGKLPHDAELGPVKRDKRGASYPPRADRRLYGDVYSFSTSEQWYVQSSTFGSEE